MKLHRINDKDHIFRIEMKTCGIATERRNGMRKQDKDIALFVAFCIEEYGAAKGLNGEQVLDLFTKYGLTEYLSEFYEPLHTQGRQWLIEEIDEFINIRKNRG